MKTPKLNPGRFALSVLMATALASLPYVTAAGQGTQTQTVQYSIEVAPGKPIVLPDSIPLDVQGEILKAIAEAPLDGQPVVVTAPENYAKYPAAVKEALRQIQDQQTGTSPRVTLVEGACVIVIIVIVIIILGIIFYKVIKACKKRFGPPPGTNAPPPTLPFDPYPAIAQRTASIASIPVNGPVLTFEQILPPEDFTSGLPNKLAVFTNDLTLQYSTNLASWLPAVTFQIGDLRNNDDGTLWCPITVITNGVPMGFLVACGNTNDGVLYQSNYLSRPLPLGPFGSKDKTFFRVRPE